MWARNRLERKMTIEEAIVILKKLWCYEKVDYSEKEIRNALDIAIKVLEKQLLKKPLSNNTTDDNYILLQQECPRCGESVLWAFDYCPSCGQALDWS